MKVRFPDLSTIAIHAGAEPDPMTGSVIPPIHQTSTFAQSAPGEHHGWDYSRAGNPTRDHLESAFAALEGANHGLAFSSGLAAEQAIIQTLKPGDRVVVCDDVYGGTGRLFRKLFSKFGIEFDFVDLTDQAEAKSAIHDGAKLVWVESPSNPTMKVIDIELMAELAHQVGAKLVVDNTFASPVFQQPLAMGADLVLHSTTKYIGGHSDLVGGAVMTSDDEWAEQIRFVQFAAGAVPSPMDCFLLHRSIKTLVVRMRQHEANAIQVANFLAEHPRIKQVYYPGHKSHPQHELAARQMNGFSGMVSFDLNGDFDEVVSFLQKLKVFTLAESLGGVESLVNHPEKMTHASVPAELRRKLGIGPTLVRLSVGIESGEDLVADLQQALT